MLMEQLLRKKLRNLLQTGSLNYVLITEVLHSIMDYCYVPLQCRLVERTNLHWTISDHDET